MPVRIRYVPLPGGERTPEHSAPAPLQETFLRGIARTLENTPGALELLRLRCMETEGFAYYSRAAGGILADFKNLETLEDCPRQAAGVLFPRLDTSRSLSVCHLPAGLLRWEEYERLQTAMTSSRRSALETLPAALLMPEWAAEPCCFTGTGNPVYGIPIHRFSGEPDWKEPEDGRALLLFLIGKGFLPHLEPVAGLSWEMVWSVLKGEKSPALPPLPKADPAGTPEERKRWENLLQFYRQTGFRAANLAIYPDSLLQSAGSWDLYPFARRTREELPPEEGPWYEVTGLYARDPREDLASDAEYVAIDFGTTSTVAAVLQDNGSIVTVPVGGGPGVGQMGNPTILKFSDLGSFLTAYEKSPFRPNTEFTQVSTSHSAQADFESPSRKYVLQYLNQLKQWVNDPNRLICLTDYASGRDITLGREMDAASLTVDPIELYAYYIGRSLNDMRWGKVYRKYLLSYSATYSRYSQEWIRSSFEKGLRKSLPREVGETSDIEVQLWRDEASCYAVCALNRFLLADEGACMEELQRGVFYGIYDFGGGSLDFSFGVMTFDPQTEVQHFRQLQCGGSPVMGCENLLDELAFLLFSQNFTAFQRQKKTIKCSIPIGADSRQYHNSPVAGVSEAARYNTCSLTAYLRKKWIGNAAFPDEEEPLESLKLLDEDGRVYEWVGNSGGTGADTIQMELSDTVIEQFFREKVSAGIRLFLDCREAVVSSEAGQDCRNRPCHIFLAGSASQAPRVWKLFAEMTGSLSKEGGDAPVFIQHRPLPTDADIAAQQKNSALDIPTAKSGVAYGLLLSRPGAENVKVELAFPKTGFRYHIGRRTKIALNDGKGLFHLLLAKTDVPFYEAKSFRFLREVPQRIFELLCTFDDSFALTGQDRGLDGSIRVLSLCLPDACAWEGRFLYLRALPSSDTAAELGLSSLEAPLLGEAQVQIIGQCDFARGSFTPAARILPSEPLTAQNATPSPEPDSLPAAPDRTPEPPQQSPPMSKSPQENPPMPEPPQKSPHFPTVSDAGHYEFGVLRPGSEQPVWRASTAKQQEKVFFGDISEDALRFCWRMTGADGWEELAIPLEDSGIMKRMFLIESAPPLLRLQSMTAKGQRRVYTVDLQARTVRREDEGGNVL